MCRLIAPQTCASYVTAAAFILASCAASPALAQEPAPTEENGSSAELRASARVAFDYPDAPAATVEVDLGPGLIHDLLGLVDAAVAGFLEGADASAETANFENMQFAAEQMTAVRDVTDVAAGIIEEVHVRIYENLPESNQVGQSMADHYDQKLREQGWEAVLKIQDGVEGGRVCLLRHAESIRGVFVCVFGGREVMLVSVAGDLSPENVHRLTATAAATAAKLGLLEQLDQAIGEIKRELGR